MTRLKCVAASVLLALLIIAPAARSQAPDLESMDIVQRSLPPGPVAFVDGESVSREDFLDRYTLILEGLRERGDANPSDDTRIKAAIATLSELAQQAFLLAEAKRRNIHIADSQVAEAYAAEVKRLQDLSAAQGLARPSEAEILQKGGQNAQEVRDDIRNKLMMKAAMDLLIAEKDIEVTDAEVAQFLKNRPEVTAGPERIHLRQILVRPGPVSAKASEAAWTDARKRIDAAFARIRAGERFEAVARDVSEAPDADRGGDMGVLPIQAGRGGLPPFLVDVVKSLKPGELSPVFRSEFGWHLVKLEARIGPGTATGASADPRVREFIKAAKSESALNEIIEPILQDPDRVRIYMELPKSIAAQMRSRDAAQ